MDHTHEEPRPMQGVRIIDFGHVRQGPVATQMLADFGADVIKIERPGRGDWTRDYGPFVGPIRCVSNGGICNKRSMVVDAKHAEGNAILNRLLATADVVVLNFRPGVDAKLGLDSNTLARTNPRLVHASSSGWGDRGPYVESDDDCRPGRPDVPLDRQEV